MTGVSLIALKNSEAIMPLKKNAKVPRNYNKYLLYRTAYYKMLFKKSKKTAELPIVTINCK